MKFVGVDGGWMGEQAMRFNSQRSGFREKTSEISDIWGRGAKHTVGGVNGQFRSLSRG